MIEATLELDKQVAEIIGHKVCDRATAVEMSNRIVGGNPWDSWYANPFYLEDSLTKFGMDPLPRYSLDLNAAFEAAEKFGLFSKWNCKLGGTDEGVWFVCIRGQVSDICDEDSPAKAVCVAILKLAKAKERQ